jgi:hypothetical protein
MDYYDEELLEARREQERKKHTTIESGIYAGDTLIQFVHITLPNSKIHLPLPEHFVTMPETIKEIKYPSKFAPDFIMTSLDSMINFSFNILDEKNGDIKAMGNQFQKILVNVNPAINIKSHDVMRTSQGNEMYCFEYDGYLLDGQSFNHVSLVKMQKSVLHCIFSCPACDSDKWRGVLEQVVLTIEEDV